MSESSSSSVALTRSLMLKRSEIAKYVEGRTQGYRVRFDVSEAVCMAAEIFVYQRSPGAIAGTMIDEFSNVASPADLEEYPVDKPVLTTGFYRLSYVDLVFRNMALLLQSAEALVCDISVLVTALNQLDLLTEHTVVLTGVECSTDISD